MKQKHYPPETANTRYGGLTQQAFLLAISCVLYVNSVAAFNMLEAGTTYHPPGGHYCLLEFRLKNLEKEFSKEVTSVLPRFRKSRFRYPANGTLYRIFKRVARNPVRRKKLACLAQAAYKFHRLQALNLEFHLILIASEKISRKQANKWLKANPMPDPEKDARIRAKWLATPVSSREFRHNKNGILRLVQSLMFLDRNDRDILRSRLTAKRIHFPVLFKNKAVAQKAWRKHYLIDSKYKLWSITPNKNKRYELNWYRVSTTDIIKNNSVAPYFGLLDKKYLALRKVLKPGVMLYFGKIVDKVTRKPIRFDGLFYAKGTWFYLPNPWFLFEPDDDP